GGVGIGPCTCAAHYNASVVRAVGVFINIDAQGVISRLTGIRINTRLGPNGITTGRRRDADGVPYSICPSGRSCAKAVGAAPKDGVQAPERSRPAGGNADGVKHRGAGEDLDGGAQRGGFVENITDLQAALNVGGAGQGTVESYVGGINIGAGRWSIHFQGQRERQSGDDRTSLRMIPRFHDFSLSFSRWVSALSINGT